MKIDISFIIASVILGTNAIFVLYGRLYYPSYFHSDTISFAENYYVLVMGGLFVTGSLFIMWCLLKMLIKDIKSLFKFLFK